MATLIIEHDGKRKGGPILGRVLVGRMPTNGVAIPDPAASRLHAWIEPVEGRFVIGDCGSLTGTFVNEQPLTERRDLADGDVIRIARATITFHTSDELPQDVEAIDLAARPPTADPSKVGILFNCECGAPAWVKFQEAGQTYECQHCGGVVTVPDAWGATGKSLPGIKRSAQPRTRRQPRPAAPKQPTICSVCQHPITEEDPQVVCPACSLVFHAECWQQNLGCSAYGCSQVNVLAGPDYAGTAALDQAKKVEDDEGGAPWEFVLLASSVVGLLVGTLTFGVPAAIAAIACIFYLFRMPQESKRKVVAIATALCVFGVFAGLVTSWFWYYGKPIWRGML